LLPSDERELVAAAKSAGLSPVHRWSATTKRFVTRQAWRDTNLRFSKEVGRDHSRPAF